MLLLLSGKRLNCLLFFCDLLLGMLFEVGEHIGIVFFGLGLVFSKLQLHLLCILLVFSNPIV